MKWRLSNLAIAELVATVILVVITIFMVSSTYKTYYLQSYIPDALKYYHSGPKYFEESLKVLDKAQATDPNYAPIYNLYGAIFSHPAKLRLKQAKVNYQKVLELAKDPRDLYNARLALGILSLYQAEGQKDKTKKRDFYTKAEEHFDKAAQLAKGSPDAQIYRWILLSTQNQSGKSKGSLREIQELLKETASSSNLPDRSTLVSFYYQRARELATGGELFKACDYLRRAFRLDTRNEQISLAIASVLEKLLDRGWEDENVLDKKLRDILYVEEMLFLSAGDRSGANRESLLGLDAHRPLLTSKLGYAYARAGDLAAKKFGWLKDITGLNIQMAKQLSHMHCTKAEQMIQRGLKLLQDAISYNRSNRKNNTIAQAFCMLYQARTFQIWIRHYPSKNPTYLYGKMKDTYHQIGDITFLDSAVRRNSYSNVAYCYGKMFQPVQARRYADRAFNIDRTDPRPHINAAVFLDETPRTQRDSIAVYEKALKIFEENLAQGRKYSEGVMELKEKVALRLKALKKKYKMR